MTRSSENTGSPFTLSAAPRPFRLALVGCPNVGKTTLFNRLCGEHHTTSNFPGTTQEARVGRTRADRAVELIDLPGLYGLHDGSEEASACRRALLPNSDAWATPDAICLVMDVASLSRGLRLLRELLALGTPTVVLLGTAGRRDEIGGVAAHVAHELGVEVVYWNQSDADAGRAVLEAARRAADTAPPPRTLDDDWITRTSATLGAMLSPRRSDARADRADSLLLHPILGMMVFVLVMWLLFWSVFSIAAYPMDWIEQGFAWLAEATRSVLPAGALADLLADGIVAGVGATVVFLPQIAMLFLLISVLEESGYLARGALLADRLLRPFGLPGSAFVPLLSAHACAIPAIVACRTIRDVRERVATILVAPFMSCSARLPVYTLLVSFLFVDQPAKQATAFIGAYMLGALTGLFSALLFRKTLLRGPSSVLAIELPSWRVPSLRTAVRAAAVRSMAFLRKAGTTILVMMIALWWLSSFPHVPPTAEAEAMRAAAATQPFDQAEATIAQADQIDARAAARGSFMGQIGRALQPAFAPLGYDWQLTIGVMSSFAAREVFVSTMSVVLTGSEDGVIERMQSARRDDGSLVFNRPTLVSLLVFYVLAMQCLPTLAVTAREAGGLKWALLQLGWMSSLAYLAALIAYSLVNATGA
ncbi:MAG: ferrous iron transporter B [Leptolyngbya sp. PLA3]|nr:MAG: ferrous iron transporter B [Cyanobacteria bacterium CYA]MCE7967225.1 ferrous iron transporter B [Leptolyngbya sp. PL-A3]